MDELDIPNPMAIAAAGAAAVSGAAVAGVAKIKGGGRGMASNKPMVNPMSVDYVDSQTEAAAADGPGGKGRKLTKSERKAGENTNAVLVPDWFEETRWRLNTPEGFPTKLVRAISWMTLAMVALSVPLLVWVAAGGAAIQRLLVIFCADKITDEISIIKGVFRLVSFSLNDNAARVRSWPARAGLAGREPDEPVGVGNFPLARYRDRRRAHHRPHPRCRAAPPRPPAGAAWGRGVPGPQSKRAK
jgi:hypothetical protein